MTGIARITAAFDQAAADNRAALMPFLTGGYPDRETFLRDARVLLEHADLLEVGLPYSDPLGDGPTIQAAGQAALTAGATTAGVLELIRELSDAGKPILLMTYYNPIFCHPGGERGFLEALHASGAAGGLREIASELGLATVFLIAPTTAPERLALVTAACSGFVYCVSVTGVTGARSSVPAELPDMLAAARKVTDLPLAVGFGVSDRATANRVAAAADGVVVGSALINAQERGEPLDQLAVELMEGCRRQPGVSRR